MPVPAQCPPRLLPSPRQQLSGTSRSAFCFLNTYYVQVPQSTVFCPPLVYKPHVGRCCVCLVDRLVPGAEKPCAFCE